MRDAENQTTSYEYDVRNLKTQETYPDHVSGSGVGTAGYGIVEFTYDPARRVQRKTDQLGDTVTYVFDLAGRLLQRDYRTRTNSPSGPIADSDVFTYDAGQSRPHRRQRSLQQHSYRDLRCDRPAEDRGAYVRRPDV